MNLLAIETSTEACSVALGTRGRVFTRHDVAPRRHAELVLPMVDALLKEAAIGLGDLDALAFGRGPGAFTGVRIATGVVQGLAFGARKPVIAVSTLATLAQSAAGECTSIAAAIDARMGEIYWGLFAVEADGLVVATGGESVCKPEDADVPGGREWFGVGTGWDTYGPILSKRFGDRLTGLAADRLPHARDLLSLAARDLEAGRAVSAEEALPVYLRHPIQRETTAR